MSGGSQTLHRSHLKTEKKVNGRAEGSRLALVTKAHTYMGRGIPKML